MKNIFETLKQTKSVLSRYIADNGEQVNETLEVTFRPAYENQFEAMEDHFTLAWDGDCALLFKTDEIKDLGEDWFSFEDGVYGEVEFQLA
jgi:hypothetical protein